jgi:HEAT repeat protein
MKKESSGLPEKSPISKKTSKKTGTTFIPEDFIDVNTLEPALQDLFRQLMNDHDPIQQLSAVYELGQLKSPESCAILSKGLYVSGSEVKLAILDELMAYFDPNIGSHTIALLEDPDPEVRAAAAELLGTMKEERAVDALILALNDKNKEVRHNAITALAMIGNAQCIPELKKLAFSPHWDDRFEVADALGMMGNTEAIDILIHLMHDKHQKVRENTALSVVVFDDDRIKRALIAQLGDHAIEVKAAAAYTLGEMRCKEAVPALISFLEDKSGDLVIIACEALSKIRDPRAIVEFVYLLNSIDPQIQIAARQALDFFDDQDIIDPFIDAMIEDGKVQYLMHRMANLGEKGTPESIKKLKLPVWMEMFLNELLIIQGKKQEDPAGKPLRLN